MDIPYEKQFHFRDGTAAANAEQLNAKIETVSYQEFYHHVNTGKNDFANWLRHVLHEERLADDLQKVSSIVETVEILEDFIHPRKPFASHADFQSRIEDTIIQSPMPRVDLREENEPMVVERVPTTTPSPQPIGKVEPLDLRIIEEKLGLNTPSRSESRGAPTLPKHEPPKDLFADAKVRDELFGQEQRAKEQFAHETVRENHDTFDHDSTRLIVKDFIYGLVFGLVLGLILGRIISI
jgi:hypothetical protein